MFGGRLNILVCQCTGHRENDFASSIKNAQEPYCGFERDYILIECGHETAMFSGRAVYVIAPLVRHEVA
jgi:hypothetical protein